MRTCTERWPTELVVRGLRRELLDRLLIINPATS